MLDVLTDWCPFHPPTQEEGISRLCCICQESRQHNEDIIMFPCRHFVCVDCFYELIDKSPRCPICRGPLVGAMPLGELKVCRDALSVTCPMRLLYFIWHFSTVQSILASSPQVYVYTCKVHIATLLRQASDTDTLPSFCVLCPSA